MEKIRKKTRLQLQALFWSIALLCSFTSLVSASGFGGRPKVRQSKGFTQASHDFKAGAPRNKRPASTILYGIDVSRWQGTINWDSVKSSTDFAIIQSSFGCPDPGESVEKYTDKQLRRNQSEARRVGILHGYYHYAYPQYNDPEPEAEQCANAIGGLQDGEVVCLDYEESSNKDPVDWCARFLERLESRTGRKGGLYINLSMARSHTWSRVINGGYKLWLAHWDGNTNPNADSTQWSSVTVKQYADNGNVGGLNPVDLDVFNGSANDFLEWGGQPINSTPPDVSWGGLSPNRWYGPADVNSQISWVLNDRGGGMGGMSQSWDSDINDNDPAFPNSNSGYLLFSYLTDNQREGTHIAKVRTWSGDRTQHADYSIGWFGYDASAPTVSITSGQSNGATYGTPQTLSFHISDPLSGISAWGAAWDSDPGQQNSSSDGSLDLPQGTHTLHVHTWDNVGNEHDWTFGPFTYSTEPPSINWSGLAPNKWYGPADLNSLLSFSLNDMGGGIGGLSQAWDSALSDGSPAQAGAKSGSLKFSDIPASKREGKHTGYVRAWNVAVSRYTDSSLAWFGFDASAPTVTITSGQVANSTYTTPQTFTFHMADSYSGLYKWGAAWDTDPSQQSDTSDGSLALPIGKHTLHVHTWDNVGNEQDWTFGPYTYVTSLSLTSITLNPTKVTGGSISTGTVTINAPAPQDTTVTLSSDDPNATVPHSVRILAKTSSATFTVKTRVVNSLTTAAIQATFRKKSKSATLTILATDLASLKLTPNPVKGGKLVIGTITLTGPAPSEGIKVNLKSDNASVAPVPGSRTIGSGKSSITFTFTPSKVTKSTKVKISASHGNTVKTVTLTVTK